MPSLNHVARLFTPQEAERLAAVLQAEEEEQWTYTVVYDPKGTGYALIRITEEDGNIVGTL